MDTWMLCPVVSFPFPPSVSGTLALPLHVGSLNEGPIALQEALLGEDSSRMAQGELHFPREPVRESRGPSQDSPVMPHSTTRWAA